MLAILATLAVPTIAAVLFKRGFERQFVVGLSPLAPGKRFAGPAYTMRAIPIRPDIRAGLEDGSVPNLHRKALRDIPSGSVLVSDTGRAVHCSVLGDILAESLIVRGVAGAVLDGGAADVARLAEMDLPVTCAGSAPVPWMSSLYVVDVQTPIDCCGVAVFPGDVMVGDDNGVICVPAALAEQVAREALAKEELETFIVSRVRSGAPIEGTYPPNAETLSAFGAWRRDPNNQGQ